ncbi:auxin-responsive protein IAA1-like protein [Tanacetum coccineum]
MLVGDVPWKMFVETCKRIRLMKSSEAINQLASTHCFAVAAAPRDVKDVWTVIVAAASSPIQSLLRLYCLFIFYVYRFERTKLCTYESVMYATC